MKHQTTATPARMGPIMNADRDEGKWCWIKREATVEPSEIAMSKETIVNLLRPVMRASSTMHPTVLAGRYSTDPRVGLPQDLLENSPHPAEDGGHPCHWMICTIFRLEGSTRTTWLSV
jgi:hypothetical protein